MTTLGYRLPLSQGDTPTEDWHCDARLGAGTLPTSACNACMCTRHVCVPGMYIYSLFILPYIVSLRRTLWPVMGPA